MKRIVCSLVCICMASILYSFPKFVTDSFGSTRLEFPLLQSSMELAPQDSLYQPYLADRFSNDSSLQYMVLADNSERPSYVYNTVQQNGYTVGLHGYQFDADYTQGVDEYIFMRTGISMPFLRYTFDGHGFLPSVAIEGVVRGGIRTIFHAFGGTDQLGLDGTYFYGLHVLIADSIAIQYGRKHFSAHFGDEILARTLKFNLYSGHPQSDPTLNPSSWQDRLLDYVRQDPLTLGISIMQYDYFRFYGEIRFGDTARILKPNLTPKDDPGFDTYKAREIEAGFEMRLPIPALGDFLLAADITFHENGKFRLVPVESSAEWKGQYQQYLFDYDSAAPWDVEYTLLVGQTISTRKAGQKIRIVGTYNQGRFPLHAFFMHRVSYYTLGVSIGN